MSFYFTCSPVRQPYFRLYKSSCVAFSLLVKRVFEVFVCKNVKECFDGLVSVDDVGELFRGYSVTVLGLGDCTLQFVCNKYLD